MHFTADVVDVVQSISLATIMSTSSFNISLISVMRKLLPIIFPS